MTVLDIQKIREKVEALKAQAAEIQVEMQELGTLLVLAAKYGETSGMTHVGAEAIKAIDNVIIGSGKTKRERIVETCTEILKDGQRRSSRYLVAELMARGIEISGNDDSKKAGALSAYLSKEDGLFDSNVKLGGWTLTHLLKTARLGNAPTLPSLFNNGSEATHP